MVRPFMANSWSKEENNALKFLLSDEIIVIKDADKGDTVIVMELNDCRTKRKQLLPNTEVHAKIK